MPALCTPPISRAPTLAARAKRDRLPDMNPNAEDRGPDTATDYELDVVMDVLSKADPVGERTASVFRATFDQLYDGQRTGRYKIEQLFKTEKTHFGTLFEINFRREFSDVVDDGLVLDYRISNIDLDCKFSFKFGGWMIPPEAFGKLLLVATANDEDSEWSLGVVRAAPENLRSSSNRDGKTGLNTTGRANITWLQYGANLPSNTLLQLDEAEVEKIFSYRSGQKRLNELFRIATNMRISRNIVATVAQQDDPLKRVRANGGSRTALAPEGYIIPGGDYVAHQRIAEQLGCEIPQPGEFVCVRVVPAIESDSSWAEISGGFWRLASETDPAVPAPSLPTVKK